MMRSLLDEKFVSMTLLCYVVCSDFGDFSRFVID